MRNNVTMAKVRHIMELENRPPVRSGVEGLECPMREKHLYKRRNDKFKYLGKQAYSWALLMCVVFSDID